MEKLENISLDTPALELGNYYEFVLRLIKQYSSHQSYRDEGRLRSKVSFLYKGAISSGIERRHRYAQAGSTLVYGASISFHKKAWSTLST